jgi:hypothetical protein
VLWRLRGDDRWQAGEGITFPPPRGSYDSGPDDSGMLDILLDDIADRYVAFAEDYYEMQVDRTAVLHIVTQIAHGCRVPSPQSGGDPRGPTC